MSISENIKNLRELYELTQDELGSIAGVTGKAVSTWENGSKIPRMGALQKMADHFGLAKSDIIEGKIGKPSDDDRGFSKNKEELLDLISNLTEQEAAIYLSALKTALKK